MPSSYSPNKAYELQAAGENVDTWGDPHLNANFSLIDTNLGGSFGVALTNADVTLSTADAENLTYLLTGTLSANVAVIFPQVGGIYVIDNATTGNFTVTIKTSGVGRTVVAPQGYRIIVSADDSGANMDLAPSAIPADSPIPSQFRLTGTISPSSLSSSQNDYAPSGLSGASWLRLTASANVNITGLTGGAAGRILYLENIASSTGTISLLPANASSSAANRFALAAPIPLAPGQAAAIIYDATSSLWRPLSTVTAQPAGAGFKGLAVQATSNTAVSISADAVTLEDTYGAVYRAQSVSVAASITTSGANGLDTGSEAPSTWYSVWIIFAPATGVVASLLSTSATSPTMPSGYTFKARVGWVRNDSAGNFWRMIQYGRRAQVVIGTNPAELPQIVAGQSGNTSTPSWTTVGVTSFVPPTSSIIWLVAVQPVTGSDGHTLVAPNSNYGGRSSTANPPPILVFRDSGVSQSGGNVIASMVLESSNIYYAAGNSNARVLLMGWEDNL